MAETRGEVRTWEVVFSAAALAAFAVFALRWGAEGLVHNRKVQIVPDLKGKPVSAALDLLAPVNLALRKEGEEFNNAVPIGAILRQNPPPGTKVREGKILRVVVSQGGETVFAPVVTGLPLRNAESLLRQSQLLLGEVSEAYSLKYEKGTVMTQDPKSEASVERNSMVNVVVSGGAPPAGVVLMPDFLRKDLAAAEGWATQNNFSVTVVKDFGALFPYGVILAQEPAPDAALSADQKVKLTISGRTKTAAGTPTKTIRYEVSQGSSDSLVRIVVVDQYGEREVFNGMRPPGSKIDLPVPDTGAGARMKVFLNGILVEEKDL
ncbi:MAG: PASTA domain-containing protein [Elusimicrobia bacterium]|nr:PASTA domain-containing protein [Elusimicrobiota bacterium]